MTRCAAKISERPLSIRSDWHDRDRRCLRAARTLIEGRGYCYQHADTYREHWAIVNRIRSLPDREIK